MDRKTTNKRQQENSENSLLGKTANDTVEKDQLFSAVGLYMNPSSFFAIMNIALYWTWIFSTYFTNVLIVPIENLYDSAFLLKGAGLLGSACFFVAFILVGKSNNVLVNRVIDLMPFVVGPAPCYLVLASALGLIVTPAVGVLIWFVMGLGSAAALTANGRVLIAVDSEHLSFTIAIATLLSGVFYLMVTNMHVYPATVAIIVTIILTGITPRLIISAALGKLSSQNLDSIKGSVAYSENGLDNRTPTIFTTVKIVPELRWFIIEMFFYSLVFGITFCVGFSVAIQNSAEGYIWLALCLPGILLMLYATILNRRFDLKSIQWFLLSISAFLLLPMSFVEMDSWLIFCTLLIFTFTCYDMLSFVQLIGIINMSKLNLVRYFAFGRAINASGVFIGWVIGYYILSYHLFNENVFTFISILLVMFLVLIIAFVNRPSQLSLETAEGSRISEGYWVKSCRELAAEHKLSPRETEVFYYLVKGRDAEYIREALYISYHTARTHIHHIYEKTGVHTQQELINMVEHRVQAHKIVQHHD